MKYFRSVQCTYDNSQHMIICNCYSLFPKNNNKNDDHLISKNCDDYCDMFKSKNSERQ